MGLGLLFLFTPEIGQKALHFFMDSQSCILYSLRNTTAAVCLVLSQQPGLLTAFETRSLRLVLSGWCCLFLKDVFK